MALGRRPPAAGLRHHAARGSQDAWHASHQLLAAHGRRCRMSEPGAGWANAVAERCCGRLTGDRTALRHYPTRQAARDDGVESLAMCSNSTRVHSYLGSVSPNDDEAVETVAALSVRFPLTTTKTLQVRQALARVGTHTPGAPRKTRIITQPPKTSASWRTVTVPGECIAALRKHKAHQAEERLLFSRHL
jgi:hypothetical protein